MRIRYAWSGYPGLRPHYDSYCALSIPLTGKKWNVAEKRFQAKPMEKLLNKKNAKNQKKQTKKTNL